MPQCEGMPEDPLGLGAVDREIRANERAERAREAGGDEHAMHIFEDGYSSEEHEQFLRDMAAFESGPFTTRYEMLEGSGVELPRPETLDDAALTAKPWEVIGALAAQDAYLYRTDHLSDRELYEELWSDVLREETPVLRPGSGWVCHIDLIGSGSDEDLATSLRYYDSEEERRAWAAEFPDLVIPPHEDPPYDRDRLLPTPPLPEARGSDVDDDWADEDGDDDWPPGG